MAAPVFTIVTVVNNTTVVAETDADVDVASEWTLSGSAVAVATQLTARKFSLEVAALLPGISYTLTATLDGPGGSGSDSFDFTVSPTVTDDKGRRIADPTLWPCPFPYSLLQSLLFSIGKELQYLNGRVPVVLTRDLLPTDTILYCASTAGLPPTGRLVFGDVRIEYGGRYDTHLSPVYSRFRSATIPKDTIGLLDRFALPADNKLYELELAPGAVEEVGP